MSINYAYLSLANVMVFITIGCHWVACMWGLQASFAPLSSWYSMEFYTGTERARCGMGMVHGHDAWAWCMGMVVCTVCPS